MNSPRYKMVDVSFAAENFLKEFNPANQLPIPIEEIVELKMKIGIMVIPGLKKLLGIDSFISSNFSQITIDEFSYTKFAERTRFSIAHEIGHIILHKNWYENHGPKTIDDYLIFHEKIDRETYKFLEIQASTFAGLVLVPTKLLLEELKKRLGKIPNNENPEFLRPVFQDLLDLFQVSGEVLLRRMIREKIINNISN